MTSLRRRVTGVTVLVSCLLLTAGCGGGPVTSKIALSTLGHDVVRDGSALTTKAAGRFGTNVHVIRPGLRDLGCEGGRQRRYAAKITASVPSADRKDLDTVLARLASSSLDPEGYHLQGKESSASLQFQTKPKDAGEQRTVLTVLTHSGDHFTWVVRALTACIKKG